MIISAESTRSIQLLLKRRVSGMVRRISASMIEHTSCRIEHNGSMHVRSGRDNYVRATSANESDQHILVAVVADDQITPASDVHT